MGRNENGNPAIASLQRSVFSKLAPRIKSLTGPVYRLHVGDTYLQPAIGAHLSDQTESGFPGVHKYASPRGDRELIQAIVDRRRGRPGDTNLVPEQILITTGVTGALSATVRALMAPGQEVLILGPYWPLIRGMSISHGLSYKEVPFYDRITSAESARELLNGAVSKNTAAIYLNWPNNPSGLIPSQAVADAIVEFALENDLWVISDEVYEELVFEGPSPNLASYDELEGRLIRTFSFSKAYGMAGNRVGYLISSADVVRRVEQLTTYLVYSVSTGGQRCALEVLRNGDSWLGDAKKRYEAAGRETAQRLGVPMARGGTFLFVDVSSHVDERGTLGLCEDVLEEGLIISPGEIFGADYDHFVRVCFTSAHPDEVRQGVDILARRLGR